MDEKITTSAAENAENTAQAEQAAAPAQSSTQDGTATEAVTQSEPQAEQKAEPSGKSEAEKTDGGKSSGAESPRESDNSQEENKQEIAELKGKVHALSVGVAADCIEDVLALAKSKVGGDITLDKAIDSVIEKYPNFKSEKQPPKAIVTSAVATANDEQNTADEARINKIMGIK